MAAWEKIYFSYAPHAMRRSGYIAARLTIPKGPLVCGSVGVSQGNLSMEINPHLTFQGQGGHRSGHSCQAASPKTSNPEMAATNIIMYINVYTMILTPIVLLT